MQASAVTADAVTHIRSHISHPPPITCHANHRSKAPHDNGHNGSVHLMWILDHRRQDVDAHFGHPDISFPKDKCRIEDIGPQNGSTHAFKWDLKAKMDETMGKECTRSFGFHWADSILLKTCGFATLF